VQRRLEKIAAAAGGNSFREVAEELLDKQVREGRAGQTLKKNRWLLEPAYKIFGERPIGEITAPELLHALRTFEQRGRYESARRMRTIAGMVFRYAIATGRASRVSRSTCGARSSPESEAPRGDHRASGSGEAVAGD
jgi:hypothetical protein